jgi:hypothetical protein
VLSTIILRENSSEASTKPPDSGIVAQYVNYRAALFDLLRISEVVVNPVRRVMIANIAELAALRIVELRSNIEAKGVPGLSQSFLSECERAGISPDLAGPVRIPASHGETRTRVDHLIRCFSGSSGVNDKAGDEPDPTVNEPVSPQRQRIQVHDSSGTKRVHSRSRGMCEEEALTVIAASYRMWRVKKNYRTFRDKELRAAGLLPPQVYPECIDQATRYIRHRKEKAKLACSEREALKREAVMELKDCVSTELDATFVRETMNTVIAYYEKNKTFPDSVEALINPQPIPAQPKKSTKKPTKTVVQEPQWSTVTELAALLDHFDWNQEIPLISSDEEDLIRQQLKIEKIASLNRKLIEYRSKIDGIPTTLPPENEEQDMIDLIKVGILGGANSSGFADIVGNVFSDGIIGTVATLMEKWAYPLSSNLIWKHFPGQSLCIYGPRGCGKTALVHALACDAKCALFTIRELKTDSIGMIVKVARKLEPSIIFLDRLDELMSVKTHHSKKSPTKTGEAMAVDLIETLKSKIEGRVVVIACMRDKKYSQVFEKFNQHIFVDCLGESDRVALLKQSNRFTRSEYIVVESCATLCDRMATGDILQALNRVPTTVTRDNFSHGLTHYERIPNC